MDDDRRLGRSSLAAVVMWIAMMTAMMPSASPPAAVRCCAAAAACLRGKPAMAVGYLLVWVLFSVAATPAASPPRSSDSDGACIARAAKGAGTAGLSIDAARDRAHRLPLSLSYLVRHWGPGTYAAPPGAATAPIVSAAAGRWYIALCGVC
jgi:hypothetical protein